MKYPSLAILIPCHNEETGITLVVEQASFYGEVFVIDNASTDRSFEFAQNAGAVVIKEHRLGYGNAIMTGMLEAKRAGKIGCSFRCRPQRQPFRYPTAD